MARQLIATKLYVPRPRRGLVTRPRLLERLGRGAEARLTLVSAPAGFGKTTLLAEWLAAMPADQQRVAWLSLDPSDNEPASFWTYLVTALQTAVPGVGSSAVELIASAPLPIDLIVTTLLNELAATSMGVWLVLDDYHVVDDHDVRDGLAFLLEHLPPHVHVVLSTRADPDLPLARWRVRGELVEVRAADLRFTSAEAGAYLTVATGLDLAASDVAVLEERTEGWIAALQLAALSLQGREDVSGFIARFAGDDRYIVDYLIEEVLRHQPDEVRDFLLQSAVLDRLTGSLCDAVTGRDDGRTMLATLDRANLFLVALDDRREWYRYHHLFADVLRARIRNQHPEQLSPLHLRASHWYQSRELTQEAVRHALAACAFDRAADLIELAVSQIRRHRQEAVMYGWLKALPDDTVRSRPVLSVFYGDMLLHAGDLGAVEGRLEDAERALAAVPAGSATPWAETEDLLTLPSTIAMYRAALAQARGDAAAAAVHARRALDLAGPNDHLARGGAAGFLGLAAWAVGDVPSALEMFTQAVVSLHAAGNLVDEMSSTVVLADLYIAAGRPSKARRLCAQALELAAARGETVARATAELHVGLGEMDVEAGDLDSARRHLETAAALADRAATTESSYRWSVAMALLAQATGDPGRAVQFLTDAEHIYRPGFLPNLRPIPAMKARIWIANGELSKADEWARDRGVAATDDVSYLSEFDDLTVVRLLLAQHRTNQDSDALLHAANLLDRLSAAAATWGRAGSLLEIRLLRALVHDAQGHRPQALEGLTQALADAPEPEGYVRLLLDQGAPMTELLAAAAHRGVAGDHPRRLLSHVAHPGAAAAPDPWQRPAPSLVEPLSKRELQVLRLLDSELTGPQIARHLFVSHNTVRTHTKRIFTKLEVSSRRAAVRRAREHGLL